MDETSNSRKPKYDRVMPRVYSKSRVNPKPSISITRHEGSSARVGGKPTVSNVPSSVFSELPLVLDDYSPDEKVPKRSAVVKPKRTLKSLEPVKAPVLTKRHREIRDRSSIRVPMSMPSLRTNETLGWSDSHVKQCYSSRSHMKLQELKSEIKEYKDKEDWLRLQNKLYKSCGVVFDDVGQVAEDKGVQAELRDSPLPETRTAKPPRTKAEYQKAYRERQKAKKNENKQESTAKPPKTKAEYQKEYRERQKAKNNENKQESTSKPKPKTNAEHQKAFRERQKMKKIKNKRERAMKKINALNENSGGTDTITNDSESTKASTTEVQTQGKRSRKIKETSMKKTNAQKCREYRERKKLQNTMVQNITAERSGECSATDQLQAKKPKTNAERRRKHYEAQKLKKQGSKKIPKTAKQRSKEYYERKKKLRALNILNHHSDAIQELKRQRNARYQKEYRQRQKKKKELESSQNITTRQSAQGRQNIRQGHIHKTDKKNSEKCKRYRQRLQQKKLHVLLRRENSDLHIEKKVLQNKGGESEEITKNAEDNFKTPLDIYQQESHHSISQYAVYEELYACPMPDAVLRHETDIPGDGNCLFHSLIRVKTLHISTSQLRKQLLDSPYLYSCQNPKNARHILESEHNYGDLDCIFIFSRVYNQNVCIHYHFLHEKNNSEPVRFCYFKVNNTENLIHLHLRDTHYTPYIEVQHLKEEVRNSRENYEHITSHTNVQICNPCDDFHSNYNADQTEANILKAEDGKCIDKDDMRLKHNINIPMYSNYHKHSQSHIDFYNFFKKIFLVILVMFATDYGGKTT